MAELIELPYRRVLRTELIRSVKFVPTNSIAEAKQVYAKNESTHIVETWIIETIITVKQMSSGNGYTGVTSRSSDESRVEVYVTDKDGNRALMANYTTYMAVGFGSFKFAQEHNAWVERIAESFGQSV